MKKIILLVLFILIHQLLQAQTKPADTIKLDEAVITASKIIRMPGNITQKTDVITQENMGMLVQGNRNLGDLLQTLAGASVSVLSRNDANWGSYGAMGPKYSTWMMGGLPVDAFIDPQSVNAMAIEQIEVQRGPASVLYPNYLSQDFAGTQSPLAGTVNLVLKERVDKNRAMFSGSYGTYNTLNTDICFQGKTGPLHAVSGYSYEQSDYTNYGSKNSWLNMVDHPEYRKGKAFLNASVYAGKDDRHKIAVFGNLAFHSGDAGRPNRGYEHLYQILNFKYDFRITENLNLNASAGYRSYDRSWQEDNYSNGGDLSFMSDNFMEQEIVPADVSVSWKHFKNSNLVAGTDYQHAYYKTSMQQVNLPRLKGNDALSAQTGFYVQEELNIWKLVVRAGLRYSILSHDVRLLGGNEPGAESQSWNKPLWSGGIRYNINKTFSLFANAGSSFISPGLKSIGGTIPLSDFGVAGKNGQLPNPDLLPESGTGIDGGADIRIREMLRFTLRGFSNTIKDAIIENVVSQNPSQTQSSNAGSASSLGAEISGNCRIGNYLTAYINYTWTNTTIKNPADPDQDGTAIPFVPEHTSNAGVFVTLPFGLKVAPSFHYHGKIYDSSSKNGRTVFDPYYLLNSHLSYDLFKKADQSVGVFVNLYNITNNRFEMPWQFRDPGFSFMSGVKISL